MINTNNTKSALEDLKSKTNKEIIFLSNQEFEKQFETKLNGNGAHYYFEDKHYISIDENLSEEIAECTFVHECLHAILRSERYPCAYIIGKGDMNPEMRNSLLNISGSVTNAIHHPIIYKRMNENYNLNLDKYFDEIVEAKAKRLYQIKNNIGSEIEKIYLTQQNFIDSIEYFFYPINQKKNIFNELRLNFVDNYQSIINIKESKLKFGTAKDACSTIEFMLEKIRKYAISRNAEILNKQVWDRIVIK
jgi:hypothetical protein